MSLESDVAKSAIDLLKGAILSYLESKRSEDGPKQMIGVICENLGIPREWDSDGELVQGALKSLHRDGEIERDGHGWKVR